MKYRSVFIGLLLFSILGCSSEPSVTQGYVVDKIYEKEHWESGYETHYENQYRCGNKYNYNTDEYEYICGYESVPVRHFEEHHRFVEEAWYLKLRDCEIGEDKKQKCRTGKLEVSETTYDAYDLTDHYPNPK